MYDYYGVYTACRDAAWRCLIDFDVRNLPVKLLSSAKRAGIHVVRNSTVHELERGESGASIFHNGLWHIVYDDSLELSEARMVLAHELGHILLGHEYKYSENRFGSGGKKLKSEREADMFASRLLAPACVLHELKVLDASKISELCLIPYAAASIRAQRMAVLEQRGQYYKSSLERRVMENFKEYIRSELKYAHLPSEIE